MSKITVTRSSSVNSESRIAISTPQGSLLWVRESQLDELKEAIDEFQNPTFEKGDIVKLTGKSWSVISNLRNTLQVISSRNTFEHGESAYETYKNEFEDFSATLIGKVI